MGEPQPQEQEKLLYHLSHSRLIAASLSVVVLGSRLGIFGVAHISAIMKVTQVMSFQLPCLQMEVLLPVVLLIVQYVCGDWIQPSVFMYLKDTLIMFKLLRSVSMGVV